MARQAGELWVRKPTETLQYHINGQTKTLFPEPYLTVLDEDIEDGDLVSLVYAADLEMSGVVRTDNTVHGKSLGIARLENKDPELGVYDPFVRGVSYVEVQTLGLFEVPFSHFAQAPVASDTGTGVFAVSPSEYGFRRDALGDQPGKMTINRTQATTYGGSIIEVGSIAAVDTVNEIVTLDVRVGGDSRGPVGLTEVEYITNQLIPTTNTPRLFAYVGNEQAKNHREAFEWELPTDATVAQLNDSWLAFDMFFAFPDRSAMQKRTIVLYFTQETN
ncbi:MAG: hypothetical protein LC650_01655, partial [Actinobacteria bacterium]|nr:hypothetical protein [Actinomycetota bacterium]